MIESTKDIAKAENYAVKKSQDTSEDGDKLEDTSDNSKQTVVMSGNAVAKYLQLKLPAKSVTIIRNGKNINKFNNTTIESTQRGVSEVVQVSDVELEQGQKMRTLIDLPRYCL